MSRNFVVTVNGVPYEVAVEEVAGGAPIAAPIVAAAPVAAVPAPAPTAAPAPVAAPAPAPAPKTAVPAGATIVSAPMPGSIVAVKVSVGQAVKRGDVLVVLEAMKMENDIQSAVDGTITAIQVQKGSSVNSGDVLCAIS
ncbi:MAG: biotin/lipoyl-binding protein [Christensenellaceae bacterium]|jgi:glutaconyl-CoA decarboxylase|nr:biotin/lipoyl-binding protein [Christensenellaceae bacterium]